MSAAFSLPGAIAAIPLALAVIFIGWWLSRRTVKWRQKPGQLLRYTVPGKTAAACRGLLGKPAPQDIFGYSLESAASGGWYIHFTKHNPTGQQLDTLYLLQFEDDDPALLVLRFAREAFGMKEPVFAEALLDEFFAQKLGARRLPAQSGEKPEPPPV